MQNADRVVSLILLCLAAICAIEGWRTWDGVGGTGFFPAILAGIFGLLGLGFLVGKTPLEDNVPIRWPDRTSWRQIAQVFSALIVYTVLIPWIGYAVATTLFLAGLCRTIGSRRWTYGFLFGAVVSAVTHVIFKIWLNMPLPAGPWGI
jgi:hypothetical protein